MSPPRKRTSSHNIPDEQEIREHEVLRANKELAAYFRGRRTEREARAALRIIKAFIKERERIDPASRRPLPGEAPTKAPSHVRRVAEATALKPSRNIGHAQDTDSSGT
jgi:hypothetical protein